ncbi:MAG: hypothetical protein ACRDO8_00765 [Nocardioidaceae bacterium]
MSDRWFDVSPLSAPVLVGAALVSSPALWNATVTGGIPATEALLRYLIALPLCWIALEIVTAMVGAPPRPVRGDESEPAETGDRSSTSP